MWNLKTGVNLLTDKRVSFFRNCGVPLGGVETNVWFHEQWIATFATVKRFKC